MLAGAGDDPDRVDADLAPETELDLFDVVHCGRLGGARPLVVGVGLQRLGELGLGGGDRFGRHVRCRDDGVDGVQQLVPALDDDLAQVGPAALPVLAGEGQGALVEHGEPVGGVQHVVHRVQLADVGERAGDLDDVGELVDGPGVQRLGD